MSSQADGTSGTHLLGVDVGGTFTDVVLADGRGGLRIGKVLTTPDDPRRGVLEGIRAVLAEAGIAPGAVSRFVHGTTLATNVILQRTGGPVALVTTEGFADVLRLGREARVEDDRYDLRFRPATPIVDARLTFEVRERVDARGEVLVPLDREAVDTLVARVTAAAPKGIAVCLLHAYANPDHERTVAAALRTAMPGTTVACSSDIWPEPREYERAMTTVVSALVGPVMEQYLRGLEQHLRELGITCPVEIMDSAGDVMTAASAAARPVTTVESGGAAGVLAAGIVGQATGAGDVISFDMGGTTAKAGIVRGGRPHVAHDFQVGGKGSFGGARAGTGIPVKVPVVDLAEVGAGGGSIAVVEGGGVLRVGPGSAGAVPGPACYGRGGEQPTVTDADLVLGYLHPTGLAGGVGVSLPLARAALDRVAQPLGLDTVQAARAIHDIVNANMVAAIRIVTVQRGIDPRQLTLVGFGGAGPMHVARLAAAIGIGTVVVPWGAGVASALGLVSADLGAERFRTLVRPVAALAPDELERAFADLERDARKEHDGAEGSDEDGGRVHTTRAARMRVRGQAHDLDVPLGPGTTNAAELTTRFAECYRAAYGVDPGADLQLTALRVRVVRTVAKHSPVPAAPGSGAQPLAHDAVAVDSRDAWFAELDGWVPTSVYDWTRLAPGARLTGPAVVEGTDTTVVVPPDCHARVDAGRNLVLHLAAG